MKTMSLKSNYLWIIVGLAGGLWTHSQTASIDPAHLKKIGEAQHASLGSAVKHYGLNELAKAKAKFREYKQAFDALPLGKKLLAVGAAAAAVTAVGGTTALAVDQLATGGRGRRKAWSGMKYAGERAHDLGEQA